MFTYPGIPADYYIGSTLVQMTATLLPEIQRMPEPPSIEGWEAGDVPAPFERWSAADEMDERCNSVHTMNKYYR